MVNTGIKDLPFSLSCVGDLFPKKIFEIFNDMKWDMLGIVDDILVAGFQGDGLDHDQALEPVL